jgi:cytochrome b
MTDPTTQGGAVAPPDPWDLLVRITHWGIALGVLANGLLNEDGGIAHLLIGWGLLALLVVRLVWGLAGPPEARFTAFPPDPRAALSHLVALVRGKAREHPSHNPAGALMAYALWACLSVVVLTGVGMTGLDGPVTALRNKAAVAQGDWSVLVEDAGGHDRDEGLNDTLEEVHEVAATLLLLLAALHVAGVLVESRALRRNLLRPMLTGRKGG